MSYKFNESDHIHSFDGKPLMGTSTIVGIISKGQALSWWASAMALKDLGWTQDKIKNNSGKVIGLIPIEKRLEASNRALEELKTISYTDYLKRLDACYKAHSTQLKASANDGVILHEILERFCRSEIKRQKNGV